MGKRIKLVWILSIVTMTLIFCVQTYWLYKQYEFSMGETAKQLEKDCNQALKEEFKMRENEEILSHSPKKIYGHHKMKGDPCNIVPKEEKISDVSTVRITKKLEDSVTIKEKPIEITFFSSKSKDSLNLLLYETDYSYTQDFAKMYTCAIFKKFQPQIVDSLLRVKGYLGIENFRVIKSQRCTYPARYSMSGTFSKVCRVTFSNNPFKYEKVSFDIKIPMKSAILAMIPPLIGTLLMLIILAFCLFYQIKTIMIQKRIDGIRREFLKNMIFEMKQPNEKTAPEGAVRLGETDFYYSLNELQHGNNRVILTSRQTEIMYILSKTPNQMVSRKQLLMEAWGDDSYSNSLALNVQIFYLRRALKSDTSLSIEVLYKKGYMLTVKD